MRRLKLTLIIMLSFLFACENELVYDAETQELQFIAVRKKILESLNRGFVFKAEEMFDSLKYTNTKNADYFLLAGEVKKYVGKSKEAIDYYKLSAAIREYEYTTESWKEAEYLFTQMAILYRDSLLDPNNSILCIQKLIALNPYNPIYYALYAKHFADQHVYSTAIDYATTAIRLSENEKANFFVIRSGYKFHFGDTLGAISDCDSAIIVNFQYCPAYIERSTYYLENRKYMKAISAANDGLEHSCDKGHLLYRRGLSKYLLGDILNAKEDITRAVVLGNLEAINYLKNRADARFRVMFPIKLLESL